MNEMTKIEPSGGLLDALAKALPELEGAKKNANNPHFKKNYADLGAMIDAIRPIAEHGVWYIQQTHEHDAGVMVETFYIGHGEKLSAGKLFVPAGKKDAQGFGSALTYARRYGLQTAFGLATEDDDGNAAARSPRDAPEKLSNDLRSEVLRLAELVGGGQVPAICKAYKVDAIPELNVGQAKAVIANLEAKLEKKVAAVSEKETVDA